MGKWHNSCGPSLEAWGKTMLMCLNNLQGKIIFREGHLALHYSNDQRLKRSNCQYQISALEHWNFLLYR